LALEFLALEFLVEPFDVGKHVLEAVSGVRHRDRPRPREKAAAQRCVL
jgi:hypothetical protein